MRGSEVQLRLEALRTHLLIRRWRLRRTSQWNQLRWDYVYFTGQAGGLRLHRAKRF